VPYGLKLVHRLCYITMPARLFAVLFLVLPSFIYGETAVTSKLVISTNGLNVRESPDPKAKKVATLPFGTPVVIQEVVPGEITIGKDKGHWLKINYNGTSAKPGVGYVFDRFVDTVLPVSSTDLSILKDLKGYYIQVSSGDVTCRLPGIYVMTNGIYYIDRCNISEQYFCVARGIHSGGGETFVICDETKNTGHLQNTSAAKFSPDARTEKFIKIIKGKTPKIVTIGGYKYERKADVPDEFWL